MHETDGLLCAWTQMDAPPRDDLELVGDARNGDDEAFATLYDRHANSIHDFCASMLRNREEGADAAQDTFIVAYQRLSMLRDDSKFRSWLFAIARHECLNKIRSRKQSVTSDVLDRVAAPDDTPDRVAEIRDLQTLVWDAADGLEARDKTVLYLSVRQGLQGQELADALGVKRQHAYVLVSNVKERVERSVGALLVARLGSDDCAELASVLGDWDGKFTPLMRKRVARHVDDCEVCGDRRAKTTSPLALLSAIPIIPAPFFLKNAVAQGLEAPLSPTAASTAEALESGSGSSAGFPPGIEGIAMKSMMFVVVGAVAAVVIVIAGVAAFFVMRSSSDQPILDDSAVIVDDGVPSDVLADVSETTQPSVVPVREYCTVVEEMFGIIGSSGPSGPSPAEFETYFTSSQKYMTELAPIAPLEIQGDVILLRDNIDLLVTELAGAEWNVQALSPASQALVAQTPELDAASDRFEAFSRANCAVG